MLKTDMYSLRHIENFPSIWDAYTTRHVKLYRRMPYGPLPFQHSHMIAPYLGFISNHLLKDGLHPTKEGFLKC